LAFYNKNASVLQYSIRLLSSRFVKLKYRFMIFALGLIAAAVVSVMPLKWCMGDVSRSPRRVHIRGIEYNAVDFAVAIWQVAAINAALNVSWTQIVYARRNVSPKNPLPVCDIRYRAARSHIKLKDFREYIVIAIQMSTKNKFISGVSISDETPPLPTVSVANLCRNVASLFLFQIFLEQSYLDRIIFHFSRETDALRYYGWMFYNQCFIIKRSTR
jgi:hypothetical protein